MTIIHLTTDRLEPNPWNPRRMRGHRFDVLTRSIRRDGFLVPIVARPLTEDGEDATDEWEKAWDRCEDSNAASGLRWQIIGGEQRWRALCEGGHTDPVSVVVKPCDDATARRLTLSLNNEGEDDRDVLAALFVELTTDFGFDLHDLSPLVPQTRVDIDALLALPAEVDPGVPASPVGAPSPSATVTVNYTFSREGHAVFAAVLSWLGELVGDADGADREPELLAMAALAAHGHGDAPPELVEQTEPHLP